jgi:hypothetical protein
MRDDKVYFLRNSVMMMLILRISIKQTSPKDCEDKIL